MQLLFLQSVFKVIMNYKFHGKVNVNNITLMFNMDKYKFNYKLSLKPKY